MSEYSKAKNTVIITCSIMFLLSLTQDCYCTEFKCVDSLSAFLLGWFGLISTVEGLPWLANPLLFLAWFTLRKNINTSIILSSLATVLALSFFLFHSIIVDEAGHFEKIISYKAGYWLWVLSSLSTLIETVVLKMQTKRS